MGVDGCSGNGLWHILHFKDQLTSGCNYSVAPSTKEKLASVVKYCTSNSCLPTGVPWCTKWMVDQPTFVLLSDTVDPHILTSYLFELCDYPNST